VPIPDQPGRGRTLARTKADTLRGLYATDPRVAPWAGTALGVLQAVNTYRQHLAPVRNMSRPERNALNAVQGTTGKADREAIDQLRRVLATLP